MSEPLSFYLPEPVGRAELKQPPGEMPVYLCCCWKTHSNFCPNKRLCHARNSCEPVGAATALIFLYISCLISGIYPMHGKTNPYGKMYKPENLDSPFLEKHGSLFSAASVCHGVCHEMMPELLKEARAALKERGRDPAPCTSGGQGLEAAGIALGRVDHHGDASCLQIHLRTVFSMELSSPKEIFCLFPDPELG